MSKVNKNPNDERIYLGVMYERGLQYIHKS